jgi:hypothetical protein
VSETLPDLGHPYWTQGEQGTIWPLNKHSTVYATNMIVKTGAGKLFGFSVFNSKGSTQYILLYDATTVPADADTSLVIAFPVATLTTLLVSYGAVGRPFNVGCVLVNSSTSNTKTVGLADCWFDAQYV